MAKKQLKKKAPITKYPEGGWKKATPFGAKMLKYIPAVSRSVGSKVLGPLGLALGANKAYAPPVTDTNTGVNRFTGKQEYTPLSQGPPPSWGTTPPPMSGQEVRNISRSLPQYQNGGMYNQMQQYQQGGQQLPGGQMQPIPGSDAVEFQGQSHEQGGIVLDGQTEVEGGETMDQVTMKNGGKRDYFFSSHLKHGGQPFSARHKQILEMGGTQNDIDSLARIQEEQAGRDEGQVAATGGYRESYATGGIKSPFASKDEEKAFQDWANDNGYDTKGYGWGPASQKAYDEGFSTYEESNADITKAVDDATTDKVTSGDMKHTSPGNYTDEDGNIYKLDKDGNWQVKWTESDSFEDQPAESVHHDALTPYDAPGDKDRREEGDGYKRKSDIDGLTIAAMAGQILPSVAAMASSPDYMGSGSEYSASASGIARSPELKKIHLKRISLNAEREANAGDLRSMNKFIENSGMGPAGIANRMAAYARKQQGDRQIAAEEAKINANISNRETQTNVDIDKTNAANIAANTRFNAQQQNALNMQNAQMAWKTDEFNAAADATTKDRRLMGLQAAMQSFAGINKDRLQYEASDRLAHAVSGSTGVLSREEIARDVAKAFPDLDTLSEEFQTKTENIYINSIKNTSNG